MGDSTNFINPPSGHPHAHTIEVDQYKISDINRHLATGITTGVPATKDIGPASLLTMYPPGFDPTQIVSSHQDHRGGHHPGGPAPSIYKMADGTTWKLDRTGSIFKHTEGGKNGPRINQYVIYQGSWLTADKNEHPLVNGEPIRNYEPGNPAFTGLNGFQQAASAADPEADAAARATLAVVNSSTSSAAQERAVNNSVAPGVATTSVNDNNQNSDAQVNNTGLAVNELPDSNLPAPTPAGPVQLHTSQEDEYKVSDINRTLASGLATGVPASGDKHPASLLTMYPPGFDPSQIVSSHQDHKGSSSSNHTVAAPSIYHMSDNTVWKLDGTGSIFRHWGNDSGPGTMSSGNRIDQYALYKGHWLMADGSERPIVDGAVIHDYKPGDPTFIGTPAANQSAQITGPTAPTTLNTKAGFPPGTDILGAFTPGDK